MRWACFYNYLKGGFLSEDKLYAMRHSLAHIMAAAVQRVWPDAKFGVGPVVEHGFYYDIDLGETKISEQQFNKIQGGRLP